MIENGSFDQNGQERFLNFVKKEDYTELNLDDELWQSWIEVLEDLSKSYT